MKFRKSILSLVAAMALSGTAMADGTATYLPLTTPTQDGSWILFGVNGFSDGTASLRSAVAVGFSPGYVELQDTDSQDALATWLSYTDAAQPANNNVLAVQGIDDVNLKTLKVAIKRDQPYEATEPVRSMYIRLNSATPNVKIDYKASYEGHTLELMAFDSQTLYSVTINEDNTYSNPAVAVESVIQVSTVAKLSNITDVIDYSFADNPLDARYYSTDFRQKSADLSQEVKTSTFYHFDSISQQWKVWNTNFSGNANDFTAFAKGDAYWGRIDVDDNPVNNDGGAGSTVKVGGSAILGSGLVLGTSGLSIPSASAYLDANGISKLTTGWNMIAFDESQPYIRHAATGLVVDTTPIPDGNITLTDSTGVNSITIALPGLGNGADDAKAINVAIEGKKVTGDLPKTFNIKAFDTNNTQMVIISDAKFTLEDLNATILGVTTLTGNKPYNETGYQDTVITDLNPATAKQKSATSAYGEYSMIVDLLTTDLAGGDVAAQLDANATAQNGAAGGTNFSAKIAFGTTSKDYTPIALTSTANGNPDAASAKAAIEASALFNATLDPTTSYGKAFAIDSDTNGTADKMIISSTTPFYIKDNTFTRVFTYETNGDGSRSFRVVGTSETSIVPISGATATTVAEQINTQADANDTTGVYAYPDSTGNKIIAVSTTLSTFDLKDLEDGSYSFLLNTTSDDNLSKGAVAGVYALDTIAKAPLVQHKWVVSGITFPTIAASDDNISIDVGPGTTAGTFIDLNATMNEDGTSPTGRLAVFNALVNDINLQITTDKLHGYAYHTYDKATDNLAEATIVIEGMDINETNNTIQGGTPAVITAITDENSASFGTQGWTPLVGDLQSNAVYTPNYAVRGPLFTLRNAGYDARAILKATTDVNTTEIGWNGIDLTRNESDWFKNNEFNLFGINNNSGYWAYLEPKTADSLSITNANFTPTYTYYFDNKDTSGIYKTTNVINGGQFTATITGFNGEIQTAYVTVGGTEVQLKRNGISDEYTADFTKYSLANFNEGGSGPVSMTVRATDGKGEASVEYDAYAFDYTAPTLITPTVPNPNTVAFSSADSDVKAFHVFKEYIPELQASRENTDAAISRVVGTYPAITGSATTNVCSNLTFGHVDNLRVIAADGLGTIGYSNLSDAKQFTYATMLKGAVVLTDVGGDSTKAIIGLRYGSDCVVSATQQSVATDNTGVSLKTLVSGQTARLAYKEISGVVSSLSSAWLSHYSVGGSEVIQVQNLEEYKNKPFFVEYGGKMYISAFPASEADAIASQTSPIALDNNAVVFGLDANEDNNGTSTGNEITIINNTLAP